MGTFNLHLLRFGVIGYAVAFLGVSLLTVRSVCSRPLPSVMSANSQEELFEDLTSPAIYSLTPITNKRAPEEAVIIRGGVLGMALASALFVLSCGGGWLVLLRGRRGFYWRYVGIVLICLSLMLAGVLALEGTNMLSRPEVQIVPQGDGFELTVNVRGEAVVSRQILPENGPRVVCYDASERESAARAKVAFVWSANGGVEGVLLRSFGRPSKAQYFASKLARLSGLPCFGQREGEDVELFGDAAVIVE